MPPLDRQTVIVRPSLEPFNTDVTGAAPEDIVALRVWVLAACREIGRLDDTVPSDEGVVRVSSDPTSGGLVMRHLSQLILVAILATCSPLSAQDPDAFPPEISLWADGAPGSEDRAGEPESMRPGPDRVISNIHDPTITPYLPPASVATGAAVIIAPGGGHRELWSAHEGHNPARYFMERGIAAFVLEYRLAEEEDSPYTVDEHALGDMQRAIRTVRARAEEWNVRPDRIGVMGFSAGGELVALAGMRPDAGQPRSADPVERASSRPDFLALIYPGRSSRYAFGADTPPTFIAAGFNDRQDISEGMAEVYLQLKRAGVPTEMHIYSEAGHGFGLRPERPGSVMTWPARFVDWLGDRGLMAPPADEPAGGWRQRPW